MKTKDKVWINQGWINQGWYGVYILIHIVQLKIPASRKRPINTSAGCWTSFSWDSWDSWHRFVVVLIDSDVSNLGYVYYLVMVYQPGNQYKKKSFQSKHSGQFNYLHKSCSIFCGLHWTTPASMEIIHHSVQMSSVQKPIESFHWILVGLEGDSPIGFLQSPIYWVVQSPNSSSFSLESWLHSSSWMAWSQILARCDEAARSELQFVRSWLNQVGWHELTRIYGYLW